MNYECGMINKKEPAIDVSHSSLIIPRSSFILHTSSLVLRPTVARIEF